MKAKKYTIEEAAKNLLKLIREAGDGQEVYITFDGKPVVKVVAIGAGVKKRVPGGLKGKISWTEGAFR
jgi:antitoxin (DNA-binding transcriptional repressor) of toxin-antitoxin stability system